MFEIGTRERVEAVEERGEEVPVLVVGAGPAGLAAATALARHGVESLVVERRPRPSTLPRATAISTATMELLRSWGLEERARAGAIDVELRPWMAATLAGAADGEAVDAGFPTREQAALVSPTAPACIPQDFLEPLLEEHLAELGRARVRRGAAVTGVERRGAGFAVSVEDVASGRERRLRCRYLVAADGVRSPVRGMLGIPTSGLQRFGERRVALFSAPLWELVGERRYTIYLIAGEDPGTSFLPVGLPDRWQFAETHRPEDGEAALSPERMAAAIRRAAGAPDLEPRIERTETVTFAVELAERFRDGGAFLVGDAAHRVTPRGGTGLNTAIRDAHDLGWKLAWVLRGWAGEELLDSYEAERRPIAEHNAARSASPNGSLRGADTELRADLGGRMPHVWVDGEARTSTLDLLGEGLTLFTGPDPGPWAARAGSLGGGAPVAVRTLSELSARALGIRPGGALLARPDGLPVALWAEEGSVERAA